MLRLVIIISRSGKEYVQCFTYPQMTADIKPSQKDTVTRNVFYLSIGPGSHPSPCRYETTSPHLCPRLRAGGMYPGQRKAFIIPPTHTHIHIIVMESHLSRPTCYSQLLSKHQSIKRELMGGRGVLSEDEII